MSGNFFSKSDSEYFSLIIFLKYLLILLLMLIFVTKMTLLEKNKICRTFRAVGHLGTLQLSSSCRFFFISDNLIIDRSTDKQCRPRSNTV